MMQLIQLVRVEQDIVFVENVYSKLAIAYSNKSFVVYEFSFLSESISVDGHNDISRLYDSNMERDRNKDMQMNRMSLAMLDRQNSDRKDWMHRWTSVVVD